MRLNAIYNKVWNRKKFELDDQGTALLQIEIRPVNDKRKYISTGIDLTESQWDAKNRIIINHILAARLNKRVNDFIMDIQKYELGVIESGRDMGYEDIEKFLNKPKIKKSSSFITFAFAELEGMDFVSGVRYLHKRALNNLKAVGIENFSDLTFTNIQKFDQHIKKTLKAQTSVYKQHSVIIRYILLAQNKGLLERGKSPYNEFHVPKGKSKIRTRLDDKEMESITKVKLVDLSHIICRDVFVFQMFTGLAYTDLKALTKEKFSFNKTGVCIEGLRNKTDEMFVIPVINQAHEIIKKYDYKFPLLEDHAQNLTLKIVAAKAGIEKNLTTYVARHSCASWLLRNNVPLSVIQAILGHKDIETTQIYAKLDNKLIMREIQKLSLKQPTQTDIPVKTVKV